MFLKPFRIKSNSQMKNSERKVLKNKIIKKFPIITDDDMEQIFTKHDPVSACKIVTHSNQVVTVYLVKKRALLFELENVIYPTVYFMWNFPDLLLTFTTHPPVVSKLLSGADLMLPGIVLPVGIDGPTKYGRFEKNTLASINITSNKAIFAIGTTAHSSMDMYMAAGRGKCVNVLHTYNDNLCTMEGNNSLPIPELGTPIWLETGKPASNVDSGTSQESQAEESNTPEQTESKSSIWSNYSEPQTPAVEYDENQIDELISNVVDELENSTLTDTTEEMDKLLFYCFLKTLKYSQKKLALPILTSNFYRVHMINACPTDQNLDIKKSSFKKLNKFLSEMKKEGIINVVEQTKGVESITAINFEHPRVAAFVKYQDDITDPVMLVESKASPLNVEENYVVSAAVLPIFSDFGLRKGDSLTPTEVRKHVTEYVKKKKLNSLDNRGVVIPNKDLAEVIKTTANITWEELMEKIFKLMSSSFKISTPSSHVSGKGKVEPIVISVASRSGNKKVTLVDNLELFGIRAGDFGKECQHGVAASTSVSKPLGKKCEQLLIQGNQVAFVGKLLTEKYTIPKRFIRGLELAVKNKK